MGKHRRPLPRTLEGNIVEVEEQIKERLEDTCLISEVRFHHKNNFSMSYNVFNNKDVRGIINNCCEETMSILYKKIPNIKYIDRENMNKDPQNFFFKETVVLDPSVKAREEYIYQILLVINEGIRKYLANNEHQKAIKYYKKLRNRRCRRDY